MRSCNANEVKMSNIMTEQECIQKATNDSDYCFNPIVASIAIHLNDWKYSHKASRDWAADLVHSSGAELMVRTKHTARPNTLEICVRFPRNAEGSCMSAKDWDRESNITTSINVSSLKDTKTIARDIERRLIKDYLPAYMRAIDKLYKEQEKKNKRESVASELAALVNETCYDSEKVKFSTDTFSAYVCYSGDKVDFKLNSIPINVAKKVIKLMSEVIKDE